MRLDRLLAPKSVAIVGASERPSIGRTVIEALAVLDFEGPVYPLNPKYESVLGRRCYASIDELPQPVDIVVLAVSAARVLDQLEAAARNGAGAAVIYGGGFAEAGDEGVRLQQRLTDLCREAEIALCGPNCMGVLSPHNKGHAYMMDIVDLEALKGNVGLISQSGSVTIAMSSDVSRYGFSHLISAGNEAVVRTVDYMDYLIDDPYTQVIALFIETIREPERFIATLDRAYAAGKPVVALKTGKSARAASVIQTHTGGLAGRARTVSAVLKAHRAIEVRNMEEMTEVLAACQGRRWPQGPRVGFVTASGGHAELILDLCEPNGVDIPALPDALRERIEAKTGHLPGDGNPVDAWGNADPENMRFALNELASGDVVDAVCLTIDGSDHEPLGYRAQGNPLHYADLVIEANERSKAPVYILATRHGMQKQILVEHLAEHGLVNLTGIEAGVFALQSLAEFGASRGKIRQPPKALQPVLRDHRQRASVHEYDSKRWLAEAGVAVTREAAVTELAEAIESAEKIGYPVVLKVIGDAVPHRTELGLVEVGLANKTELQAAWHRIQDRLKAHQLADKIDACLVQEMAAKGVEVIAGINYEPGYGLLLVVGIGGVLTEVIGEVAIRCLPLRDGDVEAMLDETKLGELLRGVRGGGAADSRALCDSLYSIADFAVVNEAHIAGIDVNPLIVYAQDRGCVAVDALIVPR